MTLPANIRINVKAPFPANVSGAGFVTVSKNNGIWTIGVDYTKLSQLNVSADIPAALVAVYDPATKQYNTLTTAQIVGGISGSANTWSATQTFAPPVDTTTQAIVVNQTFPTSGSQSAQLNGSVFTVVNPGYHVDNGNNTTLDAWGLSPMDAAVRIDYSAQGGVSYSIHTGLAVAAINTGTANQLVGTLSAAYANVNTSGVDTLWGIIGSGVVGASANISTIRSIEAELFVHPSATLSQRTAFSAVAGGAGTGSLIDAVLYVYQTSAVATGYGNGASFGDLILLDNGGPNPALATTASIITSRGGSSTIANLIELPNYTITGDIINVPNLHITGSGSGTITGPSGANSWAVTTSGGGNASQIASVNGASGLDGFQAADTTANNNLFAGVFEASYSTTLYGQTAGNWAAINAHGSTNAGLMIGTQTAKPLIAGTNNTLGWFMNSSQQVVLGSSLNNTPATHVMLTLSEQSGVASKAPETAGPTQSILQLVGDNTHYTGIEIDGYNSTGAAINGVAIGGTAASPSATANAAFPWNLNGVAYDGTSYARGAAIHMQTTQAWTTSAHGMALFITGTPNGSLTEATVATFQAGIQVGAPTGGDKGAGTINLAGDIFKNNTAYTNPDYVFERYFTGKIERFVKNPRAADYQGLMPLDELAAYVRAHLRLPGISDEPAGLFDRSDIALENIEALALYNIELHKRVRFLELQMRN